MELETFGDDPDLSMPEAISKLSDVFANTKKMLYAIADERGIDLDSALTDPAIDEGIARSAQYVNSQPAVKMSFEYVKMGTKLFDDAESWGSEHDGDPTAIEMVETLRQYLFSAAVKIASSYRCRLDIDGYEDPEELIDAQSHSNGTAKVALQMLDRSITAWSYLCTESNQIRLSPIILHLEKMRDLVDEDFPIARQFVRPGFDEAEMVM